MATASKITPDSLETYFHLKTMVLSNAKLLHGGSISGRPRSYDVATSRKAGSRGEFRVSLVGYDENVKEASGKVDIASKVLSRSASKPTQNAAMEDLLKKLEEQLWT